MRKLMVVSVLAGLALLAVVPAYAVDQSAQVCVGTSSESGGTWTFTAGTQRIYLIPPDVSLAGTQCSFATSYAGGLDQHVWNAPGLVNSSLALQGSGDFSCASGGNGTLSSPPLDRQSQSNLLDSAASGGGGGLAWVVWTATFSDGRGQLTGTLYGAPSDPPQPVEGVITVACNASTNGAAPDTTSVLTMPTMPHQGQSPGPGIGAGGYHGCFATGGYSCWFTGNGAFAPNGVISATGGSWAVTHEVGGVTVTDVSGTGPNVFPFPFADGVAYTLTVGADGAGIVAGGSPT